MLTGKTKTIDGLKIASQRLNDVKRNWKLREDKEQEMLLNLFPRFALSYQQIENILCTERKENNIHATLDEISENPYQLCEQYIGDDVDDIISFHSIDHGIIPNPDLGMENLFSKNGAERFRALCVDVLKRETVHSFVSQTNVLFLLNNRFSYLPEWKNHQFTPKYFDVDSEFIEKAINYRKHNVENYLYLNDVQEDERLIQSTVNELERCKHSFESYDYRQYIFQSA